ncbi:MAG: glycosyltransferase [Gemmataceae bacterium]
MDGWRLSLVLPAFNEQDGIRQAVAEADEALARLCDDYEVLVVDDGSRDGTAAAAEAEAARRPRVRVLRHAGNRGYGAALRTGFEAARLGLVAFTDADCQFHLDDLGDLLARAGEADVVVGYRVGRKDPWRRRFLSGGYNLLARALLGTRVRDIDCALKVYRRDALAGLLPESQGFFVNTEMLTRAAQQGLRVAEVGVRHRPRLHGVSSVSLREVPRTLGRLLPFWWSRVAFAGHTPRGVGAGWVGLAAVLFLASLLFFSRLRAPLLEPQEVRYAEVSREMLAERSLVVPRLHGRDYLDKPPLLYWSVMASYRAFGARDTSARLVPGLVGVLTALVTYLWGRRELGGRAGLYGALVLCLMPGFVYRARLLTFDGLLALWVVAALASAHAAVGGGLRRGWWLLSAVACGLGLLTKGPVALLLVAVPVFAVSRLDRRSARPGPAPGWGTPPSRCSLAPWYVAGAARPGVHGLVLLEGQRGPLRPAVRPRRAGLVLPARVAPRHVPWSLLLPGLGAAAGPLGRGRGRRPAALGFALASFAWPLPSSPRPAASGPRTCCRRCRRWPWPSAGTSTPGRRPTCGGAPPGSRGLAPPPPSVAPPPWRARRRPSGSSPRGSGSRWPASRSPGWPPWWRCRGGWPGATPPACPSR